MKPLTYSFNGLGFDVLTAVADALEGATSLTSLNSCRSCRAIREGGLKEMLLNEGPEVSVWAWALRYLGRSASTLTRLDLRCAAGKGWLDETLSFSLPSSLPLYLSTSLFPSVYLPLLQPGPANGGLSGAEASVE